MANNGKQVSIEVASQQVDELARSLRQTAAHALQIEQAAGRLVEGGKAQAALVDQAQQALDGVTSNMDETASAAEELARSLSTVSGNTREVSTGLDGIASGLAEVTASVSAVSKDAAALAEGADSTATALEQVARSVKATSVSAAELATTSAALSSAASENPPLNTLRMYR